MKYAFTIRNRYMVRFKNSIGSLLIAVDSEDLSTKKVPALQYSTVQYSALQYSARDRLKKVCGNNEDGVLFINFDSKWGKGRGQKHRCWREMVNKDKRKNTRVDRVLK